MEILDFRNWAMNESAQTDTQFLRGYFKDRMNPTVLLVWADHEEEAGRTEKAEFLRTFGRKRIPYSASGEKWKEEDINRLFGVPQDFWRASTDRDGKIYVGHASDIREPQYVLHYHGKDYGKWRSWGYRRGAMRLLTKQFLNVDEIPDDVMRKAFRLLLKTSILT
jgi:hypothetical protein